MQRQRYYSTLALSLALIITLFGLTPGQAAAQEEDDGRPVPDFVPERSPAGITFRGNRFAADLEVVKDVDIADAAAGDQVHYTITLTNNGPHSTAKVQVTDQMPGCLTDATTDASRGSFGDGVWDVGDVKLNESVTLEIWATVGPDCAGTVTNTAAVTRSSLPDPSSFFNLFDEPNPTAENNSDDASFEVSTGRTLDGATFTLGRNYPNPFNPATVVPYNLTEASHVSIRVYDLLGREVATLVDGAVSAGAHEVRFEAGSLPTGVYLIRMEAAGVVQVQRVTLMK